MSRNPQGTMFVRERRTKRLRYLIKQSVGGQWSVYRAFEGLFNETEYGEQIGEIPKQPDVEVIECACR